jgi:4-deoxy-L-threo-5-hexosulose-uronate ketol-isomerase
MQIRFQNSPKETSRMNTQELRQAFLCEQLVKTDAAEYVYSHYERLIIAGIQPVNKIVALENHAELRSGYFLERRELGIINVGGNGTVTADGVDYPLEKLSCLYLGKGTKEVSFKSANKSNPAVFFLLSSPAHQSYPNQKMVKEEALPVALGETATANQRTIYKYIHLDGIKSCQLVMGLTVLNNGSVWNTMPAHTHNRRSEIYFYFDVPEQHRVFHFMGEPTETRHLLVSNNEAIISPPWGIHSGSGTTNYSFIWGMAGENLVYSDMDVAPITEIK